MKKIWNILSSGIILSVVCMEAANSSAEGGQGEALFTEGKRLIETNCADCHGRTKEGVEAGIAKVLEAIEGGYEDKVSAYKLLADAYIVLALVYSEPGSSEHHGYRVQVIRNYQEVLRLDPGDTQTHFRYAMSLDTEDQRIEEYRKILRTNPNHGHTRYVLAMSLIAAGEVEEGIEEALAGIRLGNVGDAQLIADNVAPVLKQRGFVEQARNVVEEAKQKVDLEKQKYENQNNNNQ